MGKTAKQTNNVAADIAALTKIRAEIEEIKNLVGLAGDAVETMLSVLELYHEKINKEAAGPLKSQKEGNHHGRRNG